MRSFFANCFLVVIAAVVSPAQVPAEWDQWVEDGLAAEDNSEYKEAERLFGQACDLSSADALGSERLTRACLLLSRTYAVQRKLEKSVKTTEGLVEALSALSEARLVDQVNAQIEAASLLAARAYFKEASVQLRGAVEMAQRLPATDQALALVEVSSFFLPVDQQALGGDLLRVAVDTLALRPNWTDLKFARAAVQVARALRAADRDDAASEFLEPGLEAARERAASVPDSDELWREYNSATDVAIAALRAYSDQARADRLRGQRRKWPGSAQDAHKVGGDVTRPHLIRNVEPSYTLGATRKQVAGEVIITCEVWPDGRAHNLEVIQSLPYGLSWEAVRAIRKWRFEPGMKKGEAVKVSATIGVNFRTR